MKLRIQFTFLIPVLLFPIWVEAGPIDQAQPLSVGLTNILDFLLAIIGIVAIIGLVTAGSLYFFAAGDMRQIVLAKKATFAGMTGVLIALGGYALIRTIAALIAN